MKEKKDIPTILSLTNGMGRAVDDLLETLLDDSLSLDSISTISENEQFALITKEIREQMHAGEAQLHNFSWIIADKYLSKTLGKRWKQRTAAKKKNASPEPKKQFIQQYVLQGKCPKCETKVQRSPIILTRDLMKITKSSDYDLATHLEGEYPTFCPNDGTISPIVASWYEYHPTDALSKMNDFPLSIVKLRVKSATSLAAKSIMMYASSERIKDVYAMTFVVKDKDAIVPLQDILTKTEGQWIEIPHLREDFIKNPKKNGYQALHLVVLRNNIHFSIHLETEKMYRNNMVGDASHISYKEEQIGEIARKIKDRPQVRYVLEELFSGKKK